MKKQYEENKLKKLKKKYLRKDIQQKGITLISLVVTIVVLILLATVSIQLVFDQNGIIKKAQQAKEVYQNSQLKEEESMNKLIQEYDNIIKEPEVKITLIGIEITNPPTKTIYTAGENFDSEGMVVTAKYSDGSSKVVTNYVVIDGIKLIKGKNSVTISYKEGDNMEIVKQNITVNVRKISFTIRGISYQGEEGMNWYQWADSKYDTNDEYICSDENDVVSVKR